MPLAMCPAEVSMSQFAPFAPMPLLNYAPAPATPASLWGLRIALIATGIVAFSVLTLAMFLAAASFHLPDLLGIYPLAFSAAVLAPAAEKPCPRSMGLGAVAGSVLLSPVGYPGALLWMACQ